MVKMKKMALRGLRRKKNGIWRGRKLLLKLPIWQKVLALAVLFSLIVLLIYFGPRILGFAILQQPSSTITLTTGSYERTTSWNSTGLVSWYKFDEGSGNQSSDTSSNNTGIIYNNNSYTKLLLHMDGADAGTTFTESATGKTVTNAEAHDSYTKLMLHMEGADAGTTFTDTETTPKAVTANGNAQIDTAQSKFGGASGLFDGAGDYLSLADSADWDFGTGDFAIDTWVRFNSVVNAAMFQKHTGTTGYLFIGGASSISFYPESSYSAHTWYPSLVVNTWYHFALVRNGNNIVFYLNGVSQGTNNATGNNITGNAGQPLKIGYSNEGYFNGSLDEFRISKGIARWTSAFQPYSSAYGNVSYNTTGMKFGTAAAEFHGSGDYLNISDSDDWNFGAGDFTIDTWVRFNANSPTMFYEQDPDGSGVSRFRFIYASNVLTIDGTFNSAATVTGTLSWTPTLATWYHFAYVRSGSNFYLFIDGISQSVSFSVPIGNNNLGDIAANVDIGAYVAGSTYYFNGWLDEYRISKGIARWTANFTVRTSAYAGYEDPGDFTDVAFSGKALKFDGLGDFVNVSDANILDLNQNTIEAWVNPNNKSGRNCIIDKTAAYSLCLNTEEIDSYTKLLLHADGTNGSTTFTDSETTPKTVTAINQTHISTGQSKFGGSSGFFDGTGDYLSLADSVDWDLDGPQNNTAFTIDTWVRFNSVANAWQVLVAQGPELAGGSNQGEVRINPATGDMMMKVASGGATVIEFTVTASAFSVNTWYHVAWVRNGNNFLVFRDGTQVGSTVTDTDAWPDYSASLYIGRRPETGSNIELNGWLDELRISKGLARWTSNFDIPSSAYSAGSRVEVNYNGSSGGALETTANITINVWNHIASTYDGSNSIIYINGVQSATESSTGTLTTNANNLAVGAARGTLGFFNGTIDEVKIWNRSLGSAEIWQEYKGRSGVYTNWTTRTEPYACDSNTVALWHFDDSSSDNCQNHGGTITMTGTHDNFTQGKFGKAVSFDGAGDYVSAADSADFDITPDWTVDFWVRHISQPAGGDEGYVTHYESADDRWYLLHTTGSGIIFIMRSGASNVVNTGYSGTISDNNWHHVALTRTNGTIWTIYKDGLQTDVELDSSIDTYAGSLFIGQIGGATNYFNGTLDELRISNKSRTPEEFREFYRQGTYRKQWDGGGSQIEWQTIAWNVSRYSKFGQELAKDDSTVLLMHFNNATNGSTTFVDSVASKVVTANGQAHITTGQSKFGGASGFFDGSGDYLNLSDNSDWDFGNSDFTVDFWVRYAADVKHALVMIGTQWSEGVAIFSQTLLTNTIYVWINGASVRTETFDPTLNQWYHIAVVRGGGKVHLYIDGTELGTAVSNSANIQVTSGVWIGKDNGDPMYNLSGTIDEVAIYNRSLADWEIQDHFERGEEVRNVWMQTRSSTDNVTWGAWTGNVPVPQPNEQITNASGQENGTLLQLSFDDHQCYDKETQILTRIEVDCDEIENEELTLQSQNPQSQAPDENSANGNLISNLYENINNDNNELSYSQISNGFDNAEFGNLGIDNINICYKYEWKYFSELIREEEVLTLNQETGKEEWQIPTDYQQYEHAGEMYKIMLENGEDLLVSPEHRVYAAEEEENQVNNSIISLVDKTLTRDCFLNAGSFDQIADSSFKASANNGMSLSCGASCFASCSNDSKESFGIIFIKDNISSNFSSNCFEFSSEYFKTACLFFFNSSTECSGENNLNPKNLDLDINSLTGFGLKNDTRMLVSTTNFIYHPASLYLFHMPSLILSPNLNASSSNSPSDSSCFSICSFQTNLLTLDSTYLLISADQFISGNSSIFCFNSSGNESVKFGILTSNPFNSQITQNNVYSQIFKSFYEQKDLSDFKLMKVTDAYENVREGKQLYFLDAENKPVKVKSITKEAYQGKIYDVDVPNDIVLVRRVGNDRGDDRNEGEGIGNAVSDNGRTELNSQNQPNAHTQTPDENSENGYLISNLDNQNINNAQLSSYDNNGQENAGIGFENSNETGIQTGVLGQLEVSEPAIQKEGIGTAGSDEVTKAECLLGDEDCMLSDGILPSRAAGGQNFGGLGARSSATSGSRYSGNPGISGSQYAGTFAAAFGGIWSGNSNTQTIGMRGYKGYDNELPYSQGNDGYTKLLLHMDGANASTTFLDSSAQAKTVIVGSGQAHINTGQSKFGGSSGFFDGSGDYLNLSDSDDWTWDGDFTFDTWVRFTVLSGNGAIIAQDTNTFGTNNYFGLYWFATYWGLYVGNSDAHSYTDSLSTGVWYHLAVVRTNGVVKFFRDGVQLGGDWSNTYTVNPVQIDIGVDFNKNAYLNGSLDEVRISKGTARWTANFDIPSMAYDDKHLAVSYIASPAKFLSAFNISKYNQLKYPTGASVDDQTVLLCRFDNSYACDTGQNGTMSVDGQTKLLLHMDGTNGSTTFLDSETTPKTVTANGQAYTDTRQSKFGGSSAFFDGTGDYLSLADSDDWNFGSQDFTIDTWVRFNTISGVISFYSQYVDNSNRLLFYYSTAASEIRMLNDNTGSEIQIGQSWSPSTNTWYHIAFVKSGNNGSFFIDGTMLGSGLNFSLAIKDLAAVVEIGRHAEAGGQYYFDGWIDEFRVSKGIARWTSTFTVPTAQYPFEFETGKYGQGAKFNANASYLTLKDSTDWNFGAGDFSIDTWVRFNSVAANTQLIGHQDLSVSNQDWVIMYRPGSTALNFEWTTDGSSTKTRGGVWNPSTGTWYHLAFVRSGSTLYIFIDGVSQTLTGASIGSDSLFDSTDVLAVGARHNGAFYDTPLNGTLDEVRITKGRARTQNEIYQEYVGGNLNKTAGTINFWLKPEGWAGNDNNSYTFYEASDADNAPFMRIGKDANNSLFFNMNNGTDNYTKLLLHMDGGNGSTTFTDSGSSPTPKTVTANGQAYTDTRQSKFGGSSGFFDGTDDKLSLADSDDFHFDGDFTVDFWVRFNTVPASGNHLTQYFLNQDDATNYRDLMVYYNIPNSWYWYYRVKTATSTITFEREVTTFNANQWYHLAVVRSGNSYYWFRDGTQFGSTLTNSDAPVNVADTLYIGAMEDNSNDFDGWIDELRISKGIARWTAAFNVPSISYPITSTILFPITNWTANNWTHIAATWDSANMKLYINGSLASSTTSPAALNSVNLSSSMYIGSNSAGTSQCNCSIDDFAIYNYPKTSPKAMGYTNNTGETVASAIGRYIEARAILSSKDIEKTVTVGTIIITAEDRILWTTPDYSGSTIIAGSTITVNVNFTDTSTTLYDVECNISHSNGSNMWGRYYGPTYVLSNTTWNITEAVDVSSWGEGNYSMTCRMRDQ